MLASTRMSPYGVAMPVGTRRPARQRMGRLLSLAAALCAALCTAGCAQSGTFTEILENLNKTLSSLAVLKKGRE